MAMRSVLCVVLVCGVMAFAPSFAAASEDVAAANRQYAVAAGFQNQKLYDAAVDEWKIFLQRHPNDHRRRQALHYLGTCLLQQQKFGEAVQSLTSALQNADQFQQKEECLLNLGIACFGRARESDGNSRIQTANDGAKSLRLLLDQFPTSEFTADASYYLGECLLLAGQPQEAVKAFSRVVSDHGNHSLLPEAYYALASTQVSVSQPEAALRSFAEFSRRFPKHELSSEVEYQTAGVLFDLNRFEDAANIYERLSRNRSFVHAEDCMVRHARCLYELQQFEAAGKLYWDVPRTFRKTIQYDSVVLAGAKCYLLAKQYETARSGLLRLVDRDQPQAAEAARWLAQSYLDDGDAEQALKQADTALRKFADSAQSADLMLVRLDAQTQLNVAPSKVAAEYLQFARAHPKHDRAPNAVYFAATSYLKANQPQQAVDAATAFLQKFPKHALSADATFVQGEGLLLQKRFDQASQIFTKLLKDFPQHSQSEQTLTRLALALHLNGEHQQVARLIESRLPTITNDDFRAQAAVILARSQLATNEPEAAIRILRQYGQQTENSSTAADGLLVLAEAYRHADRNDQATATLRKLLNTYPQEATTEEARLRLAEVSAEAGRHAEAVSEYQQLLKDYPRSKFVADARLGLGWALLHNGNLANCVQTVTRLLTEFPNAEPARNALYLRALAQYRSQNFAAAVRDVDLFLSHTSKSDSATETFDALYVKGLALAGQQQHQAAIEAWRPILDSQQPYTDCDKVFYETAWSHSALGQTDAAANAFETLAAKFPTSPLAAECRFRVGEVYYDAEQFDQAAAAYLECANQADGEILEKALHKSGWSFLKQQKWAEAERAFERQRKSFPQGKLSVDAQFLLGECLYQQKQIVEALPLFEIAATADGSPHQALATYRAGECAGTAEDWPRSIRWYQTVLKQHPQFSMTAEAKYGIAWALQNQQKYDKAIELYEQVTAETNTETAAKARFMIGECCFAQKQHETAARHFLKVTFLFNDDQWTPLAYFEAARCFEVLRDLPQARTCYEQLLAKYPKHEKASAARGRMQLIAGQ